MAFKSISDELAAMYASDQYEREHPSTDPMKTDITRLNRVLQILSEFGLPPKHLFLDFKDYYYAAMILLHGSRYYNPEMGSEYCKMASDLLAFAIRNGLTDEDTQWLYVQATEQARMLAEYPELYLNYGRFKAELIIFFQELQENVAIKKQKIIDLTNILIQDMEKINTFESQLQIFLAEFPSDFKNKNKPAFQLIESFLKSVKEFLKNQLSYQNDETRLREELDKEENYYLEFAVLVRQAGGFLPR